MASASSSSQTIAALRARIQAMESDTESANDTESASDDKSTSDAEKAFQKIVRIASRQEHSIKSIRERLEREGFSSDDVSAAIDRAKSCALLDDMRYADVLVRSRISQGKGACGIARELERQGIDPSAVEAFQSLEDADDEFERAYALLKRRPPHSKNKRDAAFRLLMRNGYASGLASRAARIWFESCSGELEQ